MENSKDVMFEFFLIRLSAEASAHLPSVDSAHHYLTVPGFVISLNRDIAFQISSHGIVVMPRLIEMDMFLMTRIVWLLAEVTACGGGEREKERRERGQRLLLKLIFVFHLISVAETISSSF